MGPGAGAVRSMCKLENKMGKRVKLENAQRQMLEQIKHYAAKEARPEIEDEELQEILEYVMSLGYVIDNGDYWKLTEEGCRILEHEQTELRKEEKRESDSALRTSVVGSLLPFLPLP